MRKYYHHIHVRPVARGFHVEAGCQSLIYLDTPEEVEELIKDFSEYTRDPKAKQEWYYKVFDGNGVIEGQPEAPRDVAISR